MGFGIMGSSFTAPNEMRNSSRWYKAEIEGAAPECDESSLNKKHSSVAIVATRAIEQRAFAHPTRLPRPSRPGGVPTLVGHSTAPPDPIPLFSRILLERAVSSLPWRLC